MQAITLLPVSCHVVITSLTSLETFLRRAAGQPRQRSSACRGRTGQSEGASWRISVRGLKSFSKTHALFTEPKVKMSFKRKRQKISTSYSVRSIKMHYFSIHFFPFVLSSSCKPYLWSVCANGGSDTM